MLHQKSDKIFVIVPVFNENREILEHIIAELLNDLYNVIVVDDASAEMVTSLSSPVYVLRHLVNLGQGAALQTGIEFALNKGAKHIVTFDADGQHAVSDIPSMLAPLIKNEVDITLASRFLLKGNHNASVLKQIILKIARWVNFLFSGIYLSDAHNGLRAMTRHAATMLNIKENRMAHATEILFTIKKNKLRYKEIPANVTYTEYSKKKGQSVFNSIRIFVDLILHKLFE